MALGPILTALLLFACAYVPLSKAVMDGVSTDPDQVAFYLYPNNDDNTDKDLLVYNNLESITSSRYNASKNLIIYTSGFLQNLTSDQAIKNAYLKVRAADRANIIVVDWGALSGNQAPPPNISSLKLLYALPLYANAQPNVYVVAKRVQKFISFIESNDLLLGGPASIHLVGQSLGAQIMGMVGKHYQDANAGKLIGRITGTEPAAPLFLPFTDQRLDASDAAFVDVVHTNQGEAGWTGATGKVDFFVNGGGPMQPECLSISNLTDLFCSHNLAVAFYAKSILDTGLTIKGYSKCPYALNIVCVLLGYAYNEPVQFGEYCPTDTPNKSYYLDLTSSY